VFVYHHDITGQKRRRATLRGDQRCLSRVAGITLLDRHDDEQACLIVSDSPHVWDTGPVQVIPYVGRADAIIFRSRRGAIGRRASDNRIVPIHKTLHFQYWLGTKTAGVVARKLAERSFGNFWFRVAPRLPLPLRSTPGSVTLCVHLG